ncbi:Mur ligase family protein [Polyangium jinanense]|uniref:UDP-N-acetylmuramyl-tripeptide synthetase n=1 Tax=Polyangium jinanense TaxID=2829994 RepID=A0A9X3X834_9BACT|nr:UDP-N-acetylmuramyl-tripeptide synthetase [Polyangium jinanense]MDC3955827.1 UDP-N-acetylmuramyl-tripeptide synthetase [Polyangium jinanense]MDC3983186.1 UDP-N-acetylmuramyl-tripeptide synthetase [Polyangium jinanense]
MFPPPPRFSRRMTTAGVTGTNGKTTTTTFLAAALACLARPVLRVTTLGAFLDDAKLPFPATHDDFLEAMRHGYEKGARYAAVEATSEALALGFAKAWPISLAVFTNLTRDHLDAHGSPEHYLASKAQLFVHLPAGGAAILNAWDPASELLAEVVAKGARTVTYGLPSRTPGRPALRPDLVAEAISVGWDGTRGRLAPSSRYRDMPQEIRICAIGEPFLENALAALAAAIEAGVPPADAADAIARVPAPPGRFQVLGEGPRAVVDYAHSPDALVRTLVTARSLTAGRLVVVFGAGGDRDRGKRAFMGEAARRADRVVLTSDNPRSEDPAAIAEQIRAGLGDHPGVRVVVDRAEAIRGAIADAGPSDVVVIAGRGPETEQIFASGKRRLVDAEVAAAALAKA